MNYNNKYKYLYIPVEIKVRELGAKVLLSLFAAEKGFYTIVGMRHNLKNELRKLPEGIVYEKGLDSPGKEKIVREYKLCGHRVAAVDEEGLLFNDDYYVTRRIRKKAFGRLDRFFAWGEKQAGLIKNAYPELSGIITITGNSRIDLLRKEFHDFYNTAADELRSKYGKFILINSALSLVSLKEGFDEHLRKEREKGFLKDAESEKFFWGQVEYYKSIFDNITAMITALSAEFPDLNIIIRPHPSEDPEMWQSRVGGLPNVKIVYEGSVIPWLLAAGAMIHHNCTTAVESYVIGKTAISYRPIFSKDYDFEITHLASSQVRSTGELFILLRKIFSDDKYRLSITPENEKLLRYYLSGIDGPFASEGIADEFRSLAERSTDPWYHAFSGILRRVYRVGKFLENDVLKNLVQPGREKNKKGYRDHKFSDTYTKEITELVGEFRKATGRFDNIKVENAGDNLFAIYRQDNIS